MSWCDKIASTAAVGFKLDAHFLSSAAIVDALSPVLDSLIDKDRLQFSVDRHEPFAVTFTTDAGFQYGIEPTKVFVAFHHRLRPRAVSAGLPVLEMLSKPLPFSDLLPEVSRRLVDLTQHLPKIGARQLVRVGVVTTAKVSDEDLPPGIARFIEYTGRPWGGAPEYFAFQLTSKLGSISGASDRCVHVISKLEEDRDELVSLNFDWQRTFSPARAITHDSIGRVLDDAKAAALAYFEDLAEGNRFDEHLISEARRD